MVEGWSRFALRFGDYYRSKTIDDIWTPPRFKNREWMFIPWGSKPPDRHRGFREKKELLQYLQQRGPHSCFHSTAYYDSPSERKMSEKGWKGADLIFDLDGDHLPGVSDNDFPTMIEKIQEQAWTLWSEFLLPEFGFDEKYIQTSFSGHRGFHIHYRNPGLLHLDSNARRQLVNHIRGEGINVQTILSGPQSSWQNRIHNGIESITTKLNIIDSGGVQAEDTLEELHNIIDKRKTSHGFSVTSYSKNRIKELAESASDNRRISRLMNDNSLRVFGDQNTSIFWELIKGDTSVVLGNAGETDESVTVDTKRVIRWIGSLHGKCGLRVTEIPLERLNPDGSNPYNPLLESTAFSSSKKFDVTINRDDVRMELGNELVEGSIGKTFNVSEGMATFLVLKGWGVIEN